VSREQSLRSSVDTIIRRIKLNVFAYFFFLLTFKKNNLGLFTYYKYYYYYYIREIIIDWY